ncbi:MAG TPA: MFS transporter [Bdellovibrionales bacterium]|nr:MFS transporter [Bdellovibrionales bacterium]
MTHHTQLRAPRLLLAALAAIQFVHVLDFIILMPLGPQLMRELSIGPRSFGLIVSSYNLAAALAGLAGAILLDRFDRKSAMLFAFFGLTLATLVCGFAPTFPALLGARFVAGIFGGLIQALIFTVVGDSFPESRRGAATGTVMSSFSLATVLGVPLGLFLADRWGWRVPFLFLGFASVPLLIACFFGLPNLRGHLNGHSFSDAKVEFANLKVLMRRKKTIDAILLIVSLMFAGFTVIPYVSAYLVANVGLSQSDIAVVFFAGGITTFATARLIGVISDRYGKLRVFTWLAVISTIPIVILTHLGSSSLITAVIVTTFFTTLISARGIPALAMITASIEKAKRGRFLSLTSSVQQAASAAASLFAGWLLGTSADGHILRYQWAGYVAVAATGAAIIFARRLRINVT